MPEVPDGRPVVLRPDAGQYRRWLTVLDPVTGGIVLAIVAIPLVFALATGRGAVIAVLVTLVGIGVAIGLGGVLTSMRSTTVLLTAETIEHRRWFVRRTVLPVDDGLRGILAVYVPPFSSRPSDLLALQRASATGARIRLNGAFWSREDLAAIARHAGVTAVEGELRAKDVERRVPHLLHWWERFPRTSVLAVPIGLLIVIVAGLGVLASVGALPGAQVSARTAAQQDQLVEDLEGEIGTTWTPSDAEGQACGDGGTQRTTGSTGSISSARLGDVDELTRRLAEVMETAGLGGVETTVDDGDFSVQAESGGPARVRAARVSRSGVVLSITVDSRCE